MRKLITIIAAALVIGGCTSEAPGKPSAQTNPTTTPMTSSTPKPTTTTGTATGAPKVATPVDVGRFARLPCLALADQQRTQLGVDPGQQRETAAGLGCTWRTSGTGSVAMNVIEKGGNGLSTTYARNKAGAFGFFEPTTVGTQPAALFGTDVDRRDKGECEVAVGLSDTMIYTMALVLNPDKVGKTEPCQLVAKIAGMALETIKAG